MARGISLTSAMSGKVPCCDAWLFDGSHTESCWVPAWAKRHTEASARLEGREVPQGYVPSEGVKRILENHKQKQLIQAVIDAWNKPGPRPEIHRQAQQQLRQEWPALARAIQGLVNGYNNNQGDAE